TGLVFGDQGLLVHRSRLARAGGVPDLPLMEDVELLRRLRRSGPVCRLDATLPTSPRRYDAPGGFLAPARNALLLGLFLAGAPAPRLVALYRPDGRRPLSRGIREAERTPRGQEPKPDPQEHAGPVVDVKARNTVLVFARAPVPG